MVTQSRVCELRRELTTMKIEIVRIENTRLTDLATPDS